ncbi:hypothetical protein R3F64_05655 [Halomonas sp. 5021]|jgi:peptidoglycan hydrolase CwlO-like protein|uniref:hypothetical protein n=1 Tax=Halomonas sp. 5021 TaxID=3082156 RepID=UPI002FC70D39
MVNQTFGIPVVITQNLIDAAQDKIERYKSLQPDTEIEIKYLKSEISALSSFVEYYKLQAERETVICTRFRYEGEYGASLQTPDSMLDAANERLVELSIRLDSYTKRSNDLKKKISFLEKDIELLKNMLKSSPRAKIIEFGVPQII